MENLSDIPVNAFDIGVLLVILVSALFAYARGFVHEILSIVGWVGATFITIGAFPYVKPFARDMISIDLVADLLGGVVIFVLSLVILSLLTRAISQHIKNSALNILDRSLGFLFGIARGALIICAAFIVLEMFLPQTTKDDSDKTNQKTAETTENTPSTDEKDENTKDEAKLPNWILESRSIELIKPGAAILAALIPQSDKDQTKEQIQQSKTATEKILDETKIVRDLLMPSPKSDDKTSSGTYNKKERSALERLIENSQKP